MTELCSPTCFLVSIGRPVRKKAQKGCVLHKVLIKSPSESIKIEHYQTTRGVASLNTGMSALRRDVPRSARSGGGKSGEGV